MNKAEKFRLERGPGKSKDQWVVVESRTGAWVRWFREDRENQARRLVAMLNNGMDANCTVRGVCRG